MRQIRLTTILAVALAMCLTALPVSSHPTMDDGTVYAQSNHSSTAGEVVSLLGGTDLDGTHALMPSDNGTTGGVIATTSTMDQSTLCTKEMRDSALALGTGTIYSSTTTFNLARLDTGPPLNLSTQMAAIWHDGHSNSAARVMHAQVPMATLAMHIAPAGFTILTT